MNKLKRIIAFTLLYGFIFSFLHSELGFWDYDRNNHGAHDYCEVIKAANTHSNILRVELPKLELNKDVCFNCFEKFEAHASQYYFNKKDQHQSVKQSTEVYLFNNSFLI